MRAQHRRWLRYVTPLALLLAWGCAPGAGERPTTPAAVNDSFAGGIAALAAGEYETASARLRPMAAACEAAEDGRRAALLLAGAALDPRNETASPDEAARLAAHVLRHPDVDPDQRVRAETLYLLALDRGATPEDGRPDADTAGSRALPVPGFGNCGADRTGAGGSRALPELPGPATTVELSRLRAARDSLTTRVMELEGELKRIRRLLREGVLPDTSRHRP